LLATFTVRDVIAMAGSWLRAEAWNARRLAVRRGLFEAWSEWFDALYPRACAVCGDEGTSGPWCARHELPTAPDGPRCWTCAARLPLVLGEVRRCAACRRKSSGLARVVVLADYRRQPAIRDWLLAFKHGGRADLAAPLGAALAARLRECDVELAAARPDSRAARAGVPSRVLVPVPLHRWRRVERGYDQARRLADVVGDACDVRVLPALERVRATSVQGAGGSTSRGANVRGAFRARRTLFWPEAWRSLLPGFPSLRRRVAESDEVWLVDDVLTSGATLRECARALRRIGARRICALAIARAGSDALASQEAPGFGSASTALRELDSDAHSPEQHSPEQHSPREPQRGASEVARGQGSEWTAR